MTGHQDLEAAVKRVMADVFDLDVNSIHDDTSIDNTPTWESANHIQLVLALEQEFSISFEVAELEAMVSLFEIMQIVQAKL